VTVDRTRIQQEELADGLVSADGSGIWWEELAGGPPNVGMVDSPREALLVGLATADGLSI